MSVVPRKRRLSDASLGRLRRRETKTAIEADVPQEDVAPSSPQEQKNKEIMSEDGEADNQDKVVSSKKAEQQEKEKGTPDQEEAIEPMTEEDSDHKEAQLVDW